MKNNVIWVRKWWYVCSEWCHCRVLRIREVSHHTHISFLRLLYKLPQTGWLTLTEIHSLTALKAWNPKSSCLSSGLAPSEVRPLWEDSSFPLSASNDSRHSLACGCVTLIWLCVHMAFPMSLCPLLFYLSLKHLSLGIGSIWLVQDNFILKYFIVLTKAFFFST